MRQVQRLLIERDFPKQLARPAAHPPSTHASSPPSAEWCSWVHCSGLTSHPLSSFSDLSPPCPPPAASRRLEAARKDESGFSKHLCRQDTNGNSARATFSWTRYHGVQPLGADIGHGDNKDQWPVPRGCFSVPGGPVHPSCLELEQVCSAPNFPSSLPL